MLSRSALSVCRIVMNESIFNVFRGDKLKLVVHKSYRALECFHIYYDNKKNQRKKNFFNYEFWWMRIYALNLCCACLCVDKLSRAMKNEFGSFAPPNKMCSHLRISNFQNENHNEHSFQNWSLTFVVIRTSEKHFWHTKISAHIIVYWTFILLSYFTIEKTCVSDVLEALIDLVG